MEDQDCELGGFKPNSFQNFEGLVCSNHKETWPWSHQETQLCRWQMKRLELKQRILQLGQVYFTISNALRSPSLSGLFHSAAVWRFNQFHCCCGFQCKAKPANLNVKHLKCQLQAN